MEELAYDLPRIAVVALAFPKFRDGRAYSSARAAARALRLQGRGEGGGRRAARAGPVHGPLRLRRLRAGRRVDARIDWTAAASRFRHVYQRAADGREPAFVERQAGGSPWHMTANTAGPSLTRLDAELRDAEPQAIIAAAMETLRRPLALVSSFGAESAVLLHMAAAGQAATSRCSSSTPACCSARRWTIASSWRRSSA